MMLQEMAERHDAHDETLESDGEELDVNEDERKDEDTQTKSEEAKRVLDSTNQGTEEGIISYPTI